MNISVSSKCQLRNKQKAQHGRVTTFQGDPRTSWIRGEEKSAGPVQEVIICLF